MIKFITIVGARPQFIKASVISRLILKDKQFEEIIIHTGQHFDENMSQVFFDQLNIPNPKYNLNINSTSHGKMTGEMIIHIEKILLNEKPRFVLVYGDTNSTLAGAIAASKLNTPIVHIEAGLRSFNKNMPEEINRILTDHTSSVLITPNKEASTNLSNEGINLNVFQAGDIMVDSFFHFFEQNPKSSIKKHFDALITIHRPINLTKTFFTTFFKTLEKTNFKYLFPIHPRTSNFLKSEKIPIPNNIKLSKPIDYKTLINNLKKIRFVITDSGGLQKEAYLSKKPTLIMRDETEWNEIVKTKWGHLTNIKNLKQNLKLLSKTPKNHLPIFGERGVGIRIVQILKEVYGKNKN